MAWEALTRGPITMTPNCHLALLLNLQMANYPKHAPVKLSRKRKRSNLDLKRRIWSQKPSMDKSFMVLMI